MRRWAYRIIQGTSETFLLHLNALGERGWEVVSIEWVADADLRGGGEWVAWLKQEKAESTTKVEV